MRKAISAKGYGELVDRVAASWREMTVICADPPHIERIDLLKALLLSLGDPQTLHQTSQASERLLDGFERLTDQ